MHSGNGRLRAPAKQLAAGAVLMATSTTIGASEGSAADRQYGAQIYGWLPSVSGDLRYGRRGADGGVHVDADKILDAL